MEEQQQEDEQQIENITKKRRTTIDIPSLQSLSRRDEHNNTRRDNDTNISTLSQAFSFIKSSEFYTPPPPLPTPPSIYSEQRIPSEGSAVHPTSSTSTSCVNRNAILVSHRQNGNPLLKHVRNVKWVFADVVCDYMLGNSSCALYLSLRYHLLHPDYLYFRIKELKKSFKLRVVLCHVDVADVLKPLLEVTRTSILHECTLLCGWSFEECGRYLETIKVYENKSADNIREHMDNDYMSRLNHALTTVRRVNKTDVITLGSTFGSLSGIMDASMEELARCPGIGESKVKRLYDTFHEPFKRVSRQSVVPPAQSENTNSNEPHTSNEGRQHKEVAKAVSEPHATVKSALAAAFSKYKNKVSKMKRK